MNKEAIDTFAKVINLLQLNEIDDGHKTPIRFIQYLEEFHQPLPLDKIFGTVFECPTNLINTVIVQSSIPFRMICSHHLLPALGRASIGYIPLDKIIGLSKLTRLVQGVGVEIPTLQELASKRIVHLLQTQLNPSGVMIVIKAEHTCMACRGVNRDRVITTTRESSGVFSSNSQLRNEFYQLIK